ncbi:MAG TPA: hypothetical protein V6C95_06890, partial [Coleofasciculaceae cyanobacterium]
VVQPSENRDKKCCSLRIVLLIYCSYLLHIGTLFNQFSLTLEKINLIADHPPGISSIPNIIISILG